MSEPKQCLKCGCETVETTNNAFSDGSIGKSWGCLVCGYGWKIGPEEPFFWKLNHSPQGTLLIAVSEVL